MNTFGAKDDCHIEIKAPLDILEDYITREQHYSVNLHAIVNCNLKSIQVSFGYPGNIQESRR